jgi:hypothetical protein
VTSEDEALQWLAALAADRDGAAANPADGSASEW